MKVLSLNTWGGHEFEALMDFIASHKDSTDVFCLQEVFSTISEEIECFDHRVNLLAELKTLLSDFDYKFSSMVDNVLFELGHVDFDLQYGICIFYRKDLKLEDYKEQQILEWRNVNQNGEELSMKTLVQTIDFSLGDKKLRISNFHGMPFPGSKLDNDDRLLQSKTLLEIFKDSNSEYMVLGDFNLLPETKSIQMLEQSGLRNLISEFSIETTRSELNGWRGKVGEQKHADYTFVTDGVKVKSFEVPDINISDHLPMIMEFEL